MINVVRIGIDLVKHVRQLHVLDERGHTSCFASFRVHTPCILHITPAICLCVARRQTPRGAGLGLYRQRNGSPRGSGPSLANQPTTRQAVQLTVWSDVGAASVVLLPLYS